MKADAIAVAVVAAGAGEDAVRIVAKTVVMIAIAAMTDLPRNRSNSANNRRHSASSRRRMFLMRRPRPVMMKVPSQATS